MDPLHPLAVLLWDCRHMWSKSNRVVPIGCEVIHETVCVLSQGKLDSCDNMYVSSTSDLSSWTSVLLPYQYMSLATYQSNFVVVGGRDPISHEVTDEVWSSSNGIHWQPSLIPIPTKRCHVSCIGATHPKEFLLVAGGRSSGRVYLDHVDVYQEGRWNAVDPLPSTCWNVRSLIHEGNIYLMGGWGQRFYMYSCSCAMLQSRINEDSTPDSSALWKKFKAPGERATPSSYLSRLFSIDQLCTVRAYDRVTLSWVETTNVREKNDSYTPFVATSILPSGEWLLVHRYYGVNVIKLTCQPFHISDRFVSNVLPRLEAAIGIGIKSALGKVYAEVVVKSGVKLVEGLDKRGHKKFLPDPQVYPEEYVVEVFSQWAFGHSNRLPIWKELLDVLQEVGLQDMSQQVEAFVKDEVKYAKAYHYFISTKDTLEMLFLKFLFLGPPLLGKTTTFRRLIGEIVDLMSAGEADQSHPSTGVIQAGPDVVVGSLVKTTAFIMESEWTAFSALGDEACFLIQTLSRVLDDRMKASSDNLLRTNEVSTNSDADESAAQVPATSEEFFPELSGDMLIKTSSLTSVGEDIEDMDDAPEVTAVFKEAMKSKYWPEVKHIFKAYLRMEDTGGQPELMDMLPALTVGPGLYLLFFNLLNSLNQHYMLTYCDAGGASTVPIQSTYTVREMFLSALSSISCSNSSAINMSSEKTASSELKQILKSSKSVAYLVGTHKDLVQDFEIAKFDQQLQDMVRSTSFFDEDIIKFFSKDRLMITLDNMKGGVDEIQEVRKLLEECMEEHFKKLKIPVVWLVLGLCLRDNGVKTVSLKSCMKLSGKLNMSTFETKVALWFLHHHAGIIMFFPSIPEIEDLIIVDSQIIYDSVTELIVKCLNFRNRQAAAERFCNSGQFSLKELRDAAHSYTGECIPPLKLVALLKYLHIIAYIQPTDSKPPNDLENGSFIMPCMLQNATLQNLECFREGESGAKPILIRYSCGFVPIGVFPALMACLISRNVLKFIQKGVKKNCVQFYYGVDYDKVTLSSRPTFYEIRVFRQSKMKTPVHTVCDSIRKEVAVCLKAVGAQMNYCCYLNYQWAFECPSCKDLCVIDEEVPSPHKMLCLKECGPQDMAASELVWFGVSSPKTQLKVSNPLPLLSDIPTLQQLTLLRWKDEAGCMQRLRILQEISSQWEKVGCLLGLSNNFLQSIDRQYSDRVERCGYQVFCSWLEDYEMETSYPRSWEGICELLDDIEYSNTSAILRSLLARD